jgi:hypothetical protein
MNDDRFAWLQAGVIYAQLGELALGAVKLGYDVASRIPPEDHRLQTKSERILIEAGQATKQFKLKAEHCLKMAGCWVEDFQP